MLNRLHQYITIGQIKRDLLQQIPFIFSNLNYDLWNEESRTYLSNIVSHITNHVTQINIFNLLPNDIAHVLTLYGFIYELRHNVQHRWYARNELIDRIDRVILIR